MVGSRLPLAPLFLGALAALALAGCARSLSPARNSQNRPPEVAFVRPRPAGTVAASWIGTDPDGRVDHYLVSTDARAFRDARRPAERTLATERALPRSAPGTARVSRTGRPIAAPSLLTVRAVDDLGAVSAPAVGAFFATEMAPAVRIASPHADGPAVVMVPPSLDATLEVVPSGEPGSAIASIRYLLVKTADLPIDLFTAIMDSSSATIHARWAPDFDGWTEVPGATDRLLLRDLEVEAEYLLIVTAFDQRGLYDPVFEFGKNVVRMVALARTSFPAPWLSIATGVVTMSHSIPQTVPHLLHAFPLEHPTYRTVRFDATAEPRLERPLRGVRWALDPVDVADETPRSDDTDFAHWSAWSPSPLQVDLPPFHGPAAGTEHLLYFEARDDWDVPSYVIVRLIPVPLPSQRRRLLVVNDTRLALDRVDAAGRPMPPSGMWPTSAELDTFLYARGGFPWRGYPAGTRSTPGLLDGFDFDTIGTAVPARWALINEDMLGRYEHVIWLVDGIGAQARQDPTSPELPTTLLRSMSEGRVPNPLPDFVTRGGHLWLAGGGIGMATTDPFNAGSYTTFASPAVDPFEAELVPGRLMHDLAGWRTRFETFFVTNVPVRSEAEHVRPGTRPSPRFPQRLLNRTVLTDPLPPGRTASSFYGTPRWTEMLTYPNHVAGSGPGGSSLDTLYRFPNVPTTVPGHVYAGMTRLRVGQGTVLFSGFDIWGWRRQDCLGLVQAVVSGEWGMSPAKTLLSAGLIRRAELGRPMPPRDPGPVPTRER